MNPVSLMANAEKLSIGQLQQAVKNGTVPAYIGIPMMQEKIKQAKQAQVAQAPTEPPIAQQVMAEASGIDQVPSNLPAQAMNDGGIVSFADGGDVEDFDQEEYEDQLAEQEYAQAIEERLNAAEQGGAPKSADVNRTPSVEGGIKAPAGDFYKNMYGVLKAKAEEMGFKNPEAIARVGAAQSALETGYGKALAGGNNYFGIKGSGGNKQSTKEYSPERGYYTSNESFRTYKGMEDSAADYLRLMQNPRYAKVASAQTPEEAIDYQGRSGYATSPKYGSSLRAIHSANMAEGGIARLNVPRFNGEYGSLTGEEREKYLAGLSYKEPDTSSPAGRFFDRFVSTPKDLKQKEYDTNRLNALRDQARVQEQFGSNAGMSGLFKTQTPEEYANAQTALDRAREGVLSAQRGSGYKPPDIHGNYKPEIRNLQTPVQGGMSPEYEPSVLGGMGMSPEYEPSTKVPAGNTGNTNTSSGSGAGGSSGSDSSGGSGSGSSGGKQKSEYDLIREDIMNQREELKRQKQEDKYMAILQAGLGMMGGTSPNAMANIGQGASMGIAQYGASGKQRAAENAALNKGLITAQRYKGMDDYQRAALADRAAGRTELAGIRSEERADKLTQDDKALMFRTETAVDNNILNREKQIENAVKARLEKLDPLGALSGDNLQKYNQMVAEEKAKDDILKGLHTRKGRLQKSLYDVDYSIPNYGYSSTSAPSGVTVRKVK
jgi:flagellum-specific peptidoglycan hydrolase FlgJ